MDSSLCADVGPPLTAHHPARRVAGSRQEQPLMEAPGLLDVDTATQVQVLAIPCRTTYVLTCTPVGDVLATIDI